MLLFVIVNLAIAQATAPLSRKVEVGPLGVEPVSLVEPMVVSEGKVTRVIAAETSVEPGVAQMTRSHATAEVKELTAPMQVLVQISRDPIALTCALLMAAYMIGQMLMPGPMPDVYGKGSKATPVRKNSGDGEKRRRGGGKSQFAVSVNQRLMQLETPDEILDYALFHTGRTDVVNVVTALHRSAKLAVANPKFRRGLGCDPRVHSLVEQLQGFFDEDVSKSVLTRAVGNASWALAKLQFKQSPGCDILTTMQQIFVDNVANFRPEEFMNTVWAFAELRHGDSQEGQARALEVAKAAVGCIDRIPNFTLQQVVYLAWALARLAGSSTVRANQDVLNGLLTFKAAIVERVVPDIAQLNTKNIAMISWAVAQLCIFLKLEKEADVELLLTRLADDANRRDLRSFCPGELASVVWALNKCHVEHPAFFVAFREHINKCGLKGYNSQDLANILCAYVNTTEGNDEFILTLGAAAEQNAGSFNRLEKMMVHWAFSQRGHLAAPKLDEL